MVDPTRKTLSCCPYCGAVLDDDFTFTRFYRCGTYANKGKAVYVRRCESR